MVQAVSHWPDLKGLCSIMGLSMWGLCGQIGTGTGLFLQVL